MTDFDVIFLGGGPSGEHCAGRLAEGGLRVAIVEREVLGGECSSWGCIPSNTFVRPGEAQAGEWLEQSTLAFRARVPLGAMDHVIQPVPTFSEVFLHATQELTTRIRVPA